MQEIQKKGELQYFFMLHAYISDRYGDNYTTGERIEINLPNIP